MSVRKSYILELFNLTVSPQENIKTVIEDQES
jgi:hypothetical protein